MLIDFTVFEIEELQKNQRIMKNLEKEFKKSIN